MSERPGGSPFQQRRVQVAAERQPRTEGDVHVTQGQTLSAFLDSRRHFLSLTSATQEGETDWSHIAIRIESVLWVRSVDGALPLAAAAGAHQSGRPAELVLTDGARLRVELKIAAEQRLTDYIDVPPFFVPVYDAKDAASAEPLGDLALNTRRILSIRELVAEPRRSAPPAW